MDTETARIIKIGASHIRSDLDFALADLEALMGLTALLKQQPREFAHVLDGKQMAILTEKPSFRTTLSLATAIQALGGHYVLHDFRGARIGEREPVCDIARNASEMVDVVAARVFDHETIEELARWANIPVINALCDMYHPLQALADFFTLRERFGKLRGLKLVFVGDGNNVCHSLMLTAAQLGVNMISCNAENYLPNRDVIEMAQRLAVQSGSTLEVTTELYDAVTGAHAIYTDVWASMGQEADISRRRKELRGYQVNRDVMSRAADDAVFMHCLPAHRGEEVASEVIESPASVVHVQAGNRKHTAMALLLMLLAKQV